MSFSISLVLNLISSVGVVGGVHFMVSTSPVVYD